MSKPKRPKPGKCDFEKVNARLRTGIKKKSPIDVQELLYVEKLPFQQTAKVMMLKIPF